MRRPVRPWPEASIAFEPVVSSNPHAPTGAGEGAAVGVGDTVGTGVDGGPAKLAVSVKVPPSGAVDWCSAPSPSLQRTHAYETPSSSCGVGALSEIAERASTVRVDGARS